jgi:hypothetical protein
MRPGPYGGRLSRACPCIPRPSPCPRHSDQIDDAGAAANSWAVRDPSTDAIPQQADMVGDALCIADCAQAWSALGMSRRRIGPTRGRIVDIRRFTFRELSSVRHPLPRIPTMGTPRQGSDAWRPPVPGCDQGHLSLVRFGHDPVRATTSAAPQLADVPSGTVHIAKAGLAEDPSVSRAALATVGVAP